MPDADTRLVLQRLFGPNAQLDSLAWQPFRSGIEIVRLYGSGEQGPSAALLRYAPGASLPRHVHAAFEQIVVLRGSQRDEHGVYPAGSCLIHAAGTAHDVASDEGCVVLATWHAPVEFVDE